MGMGGRCPSLQIGQLYFTSALNMRSLSKFMLSTCFTDKKQRWGQKLDENTHLLLLREILQMNNEGCIFLNDYHEF